MSFLGVESGGRRRSGHCRKAAFQQEKRLRIPGRRDMAKKILIVEDNELNMKLFNDLLQAQGYDTIQTGDGHKVVALVRAERPDLVLMDIQLPEISGLDVTRMLKDDPDLQQIPVVAVTAFAMKGDEEKILQGGCDGYIAKPISVPEFIRSISGFLG